MESMTDVVGPGWNPDVSMSGKCLVVAPCNLLSARQTLGSTRKLRYAECRLNIGETVIEAEFPHLIVPAAVVPLQQSGIAGDAVSAEQAETLQQLRVVGGNHAAFSRGDMLHRMEGEHRAIGPFAVSAALVRAVGGREPCAGSMAGILTIHSP